jgi:peptide deformylase
MIITNNEEALRVKCEDVSPEEVKALILALENELAYANRLGKGGIGLAAPQIGIPKNIAIVRMGKENGLNLDLVNCKIDQGFDPTLFKEEGCLSFPGRVENTTRFQEVHIVNNLVYPHTFIATGLIAVVVQHELDHLNQTLFMDRAAPKPVPVVSKKKTGPNDPCLCGSGKKTKKCCGR